MSEQQIVKRRRVASAGAVDDDEIGRFQREGFVSLARPVFTPSDIDEVRARLDVLFDGFDALPESYGRDLAADGTNDVPLLPEIMHPRLFDRGLLDTAVHRKVRQVAEALLGGPARCTFDHAIYKPASGTTATEWHQDQAYAPPGVVLTSIHFWIPLQAVDLDNGCMQFVPGSNLEELRAHRRRSEVPHAQLMADGVEASLAVACPLPRGGMTAHSPFTLHYTGPNTSAEVRRAYIVHFGRRPPITIGRLWAAARRRTTGDRAAVNTWRHTKDR